MKKIVLQSKVEIVIGEETTVAEVGGVFILKGKVQIADKEENGTIKIYKENVLYTVS